MQQNFISTVKNICKLLAELWFMKKREKMEITSRKACGKSC
jgi:hypothetical protein